VWGIGQQLAQQIRELALKEEYLLQAFFITFSYQTACQQRPFGQQWRLNKVNYSINTIKYYL
jgi:hypothetical protein